MQILLLLVAVAFQSARGTMELTLLKGYPDALCLDGTASGIYYEQGSGEGAENTIIFFQGGGACVGLNEEQVLLSCLGRSQTELGSNLLWRNKKQGDGFLSSDPKVNPHFYNWNKAYFPYCDGLVHTGYQPDPVKILGMQLHFNGYNNTEQGLSFLIREKNLKTQKKVVVSGNSAGGMGAYIWTNFIREILPAETKVYSIPDSGFFLDFYGQGSNFHSTIISLFKVGFSGTQMIEPKGCEWVNDPDNAYKCMLPQYFVHRLTVPTLIVNSEYDLWSVDNILSISCADSQNMNKCSQANVDELNRFRQALTGNITNQLKGKSHSGAFMPACIIHGLTQGQPFNTNAWTVPDQSDNTLESVIYRFINDIPDPMNFDYIDRVEWPLNTGCNHQSKQFLQKQ